VNTPRVNDGSRGGRSRRHGHSRELDTHTRVGVKIIPSSWRSIATPPRSVSGLRGQRFALIALRAERQAPVSPGRWRWSQPARGSPRRHEATRGNGSSDLRHNAAVRPQVCRTDARHRWAGDSRALKATAVDFSADEISPQRLEVADARGFGPAASNNLTSRPARTIVRRHRHGAKADGKVIGSNRIAHGRSQVTVLSGPASRPLDR
jgi:hypothetical protein